MYTPIIWHIRKPKWIEIQQKKNKKKRHEKSKKKKKKLQNQMNKTPIKAGAIDKPKEEI